MLQAPVEKGYGYETSDFRSHARCRRPRTIACFYRDGLGLPTKGIVGREFDHGAVAFFDLSSGLKLAIWAQDDIAHDTGLPKHPVSSTAVTIGQNVLHRKEVDKTLEAAQQAGAEIIKPPQDTLYGGYAGYFRDPNGHLWEIV